MYQDSVDALTRLLSGVDDGGKPIGRSEIASVTSVIVTLSNGIRHCTVQVEFADGKTYRIEAFGEEASALHSNARSHPLYSMITV